MTIVPCHIDVVREMCERFHAYRGVGRVAVAAFAVLEDGLPVACYAWNPPPPGAAKSAAPSCPASVLALTRMVAVPKAERRLKHISKPLKIQMKRLLDRGRWPVLITFSDEGLGHNGYVYQCSGWTKTSTSVSDLYVDNEGRRASIYSAGVTGGRDLEKRGESIIQRWEHRVCEEGQERKWLTDHGWIRRVRNGVGIWENDGPQMDMFT